MVFGMRPCNRFTDKSASFPHLTVADPIITPADRCQYCTFEQAMHIDDQIEMLTVKQVPHLPEIRPFFCKAHLCKFYLVKINDLINDGRIRHKSAELRMHQPGQPCIGKRFTQYRNRRQRMYYIAQRTHFDDEYIFIFHTSPQECNYFKNCCSYFHNRSKIRSFNLPPASDSTQFSV